MSSAAKIFERVRGANLIGRIAPLAKARIELELYSPFTERRFTYRQSATADAEGQVAFTVPYAGASAAGSSPPPPRRVHATGPFRLFVEGRNPLDVDVPEEAVVNGADLSLFGISALPQ